MTETVASPPVANPVPRPRSKKPTVSASALALYLDCSRAYIGKLEAEGVIQRQGSAFPLDQSRVAYLRYLRRERRQSPRSEADVDHLRVKTEVLQLRLMEKKRELVRREDFYEAIDGMAGIAITHLSGMAARCSNDLTVRRKIDAVVYPMARRACSVYPSGMITLVHGTWPRGYFPKRLVKRLLGLSKPEPLWFESGSPFRE